jgi:DNA-binding GntR family transcriptional regulator
LPLQNKKENETLEKYAYRKIKEALLERKLAPGTQLTERSIQEAFGIGRTPIRSALHTLVAEGYVKIIPNRGCSVIQSDKKETTDVYELRLVLLQYALERGVDHYTVDDFKEFERIVDLERQAWADYDFQQYLDAVEEFYDLIIQKADNNFLWSVYNPMKNRVRVLLTLYDDFYMKHREKNKSLDYQPKIIEYIKKKDVESAVRLIRELNYNIIEGMRFGVVPIGKL